MVGIACVVPSYAGMIADSAQRGNLEDILNLLKDKAFDLCNLDAQDKATLKKLSAENEKVSAWFFEKNAEQNPSLLTSRVSKDPLREAFSYLDVTDLIHVSQTCRGLEA